MSGLVVLGPMHGLGTCAVLAEIEVPKKQGYFQAVIVPEDRTPTLARTMSGGGPSRVVSDAWQHAGFSCSHLVLCMSRSVLVMVAAAKLGKVALEQTLPLQCVLDVFFSELVCGCECFLSPCLSLLEMQMSLLLFDP